MTETTNVRRARKLLFSGALTCAVILGSAEAINRILASQLVGDVDAAHTAVVVLGFANRTPEINAINKWRVRSGIATAVLYQADLLVFSGGDPGGFCEAEIMATYAQELGYRGPIETEAASQTTEENLQNTAHLMEWRTELPWCPIRCTRIEPGNCLRIFGPISPAGLSERVRCDRDDGAS
ncbi:DUF218 domain-containing protein [Paramicrobacterium humi]|uniref:DUF218 domain-containing protein n=1 Tax=Paramicrobacterium humi TaxID=640635 RepID=A0A1H4ILB9_9MICO|nr:YdcF family protein [Microbacterium humi]SEB34924.1 DUF218 domain-containing protein [Microbacterium humi]